MNRGLHSTNIVLGPNLFWQLEHTYEHRWNPLAMGNLILLDTLQRVFRFKVLHHYHRCAVSQATHGKCQWCCVVQRSW